MADDAASASASAEEAQITFNVKSANDAKFVVTVPASITVADLKAKLSTSEYADIPAERQRLIYSGRVLKDPDTLAAAKVKDGHTVHLVKGAASNARQNPQSQGAGASTSGGSPAPQVPTNIAAGTGNNPLAGLTGARYAGFHGLPGMDTFGPDGGMGPPPGPEQMLELMENPNFLSQMNEAMDNPAFMEMISHNPMFRDNPMLANMLRNPEMRRMILNPDMIRMQMQMQRAMGGGGLGGSSFPAPGVTNTTPGATGTGGATPGTAGQQNPTGQNQAQQNPFAALLGQGMPGLGGGAGANPFAAFMDPSLAPSTGAGATNTAGRTSPSNTNTSTEANPSSTPTGQQNPFSPPPNPFADLFNNPQMNQGLVEAMQRLNQNPGAAGGGDQMNPFAALFGGGAGLGSPPPQDNRPPEELYESQLRQLNEMGFYEFDRNVQALRRSGGNVQGAVEFLLSGS